MPKSATDLMGEIIAAAVLDATVALRESAKGLPNALWRDVGAVHRNTTVADLPPEVQAAIGESVRTAFVKLRQEGYTIGGSGGGGPPEPDRRGPPRPRPTGPRTPPTVETRRSRPLRPGPGSGPGGPGPKR